MQDMSPHHPRKYFTYLHCDRYTLLSVRPFSMLAKLIWYGFVHRLLATGSTELSLLPSASYGHADKAPVYVYRSQPVVVKVAARSLWSR